MPNDITSSNVTATIPASSDDADIVQAFTDYHTDVSAAIDLKSNIAAPTFTGTVTATTFAGSGASLTTLNGSNVSSGTISELRLPAAGSSANGIVTTDAQEFSGVKTLTSPNISTSIVTQSTNFDLVNANATTVNFAGAATTVNVGASTGTTTIKNNAAVTGYVSATSFVNNGAQLNIISTAHPMLIQAADGITLSGSVRTNNISFNNTVLATTGNVAINFALTAYFTQAALTGSIIYTALNYEIGKTVTVKVTGSASTSRTLTFPTGWVFVGAKPTSIAAGKTGILTVTSFGTTEADCVAAWAVSL